MLPPRPSGLPAAPPAALKSGSIAFPQMSLELVKRRVLAKLEERMDLSASKRMPQSLLRQSLRQQADQIADLEARGFAKIDRDRLVDEVLGELLGYGPLEELFADPGVREIMVTGPGTVIAKREQGHWMPTSVKFRDEGHVRAVLDKIATHADAVGPVLASVAVFDMKLPNGFRALALIPPEALGQPASAAFLRETPLPAPAAGLASGAFPGLPAAGSASSASPGSVNGTLKAIPASVLASPRTPGSALITTPPPRSGPTDSPAPGERDPLAKYRSRILERLLTKFASIGLYDVQRLDVNELRKVIVAYVGEYVSTEKIYLSDSDQGRLALEILTSLRK
jgi:pilus assembly protein CpaF